MVIGPQPIDHADRQHHQPQHHHQVQQLQRHHLPGVQPHQRQHQRHHDAQPHRRHRQRHQRQRQDQCLQQVLHAVARGQAVDRVQPPDQRIDPRPRRPKRQHRGHQRRPPQLTVVGGQQGIDLPRQQAEGIRRQHIGQKLDLGADHARIGGKAPDRDHRGQRREQGKEAEECHTRRHQRQFAVCRPQPDAIHPPHESRLQEEMHRPGSLACSVSQI